MSKKMYLSVTIPELLIHRVVTSLSSKVLAVGIVAAHMFHTTRNTKTEIEFILNITCIRLAPSMSVKVLIHNIQLSCVSRFDVYRGWRKLKKMIAIVFSRQVSKKGVFEFIKIELTKLIFGSFSKL
jgi:hypothetical protein